MLAKAQCQSPGVSLTHRYRRQASSHRFYCVHLESARRWKRVHRWLNGVRERAPPNNVGAGLLAKAQCQSLGVSLTRRIREQARSHSS